MKNNTEVKSKKEPKKKTVKQTKKSGGIAGWIQFLKEVRAELRKVTWPPRKEIFASTSALIVATVLIGAFLGIVDLVLAKGIQPALAGTPSLMSYLTLLLFAVILAWVYKSN